MKILSNFRERHHDQIECWAALALVAIAINTTFAGAKLLEYLCGN